MPNPVALLASLAAHRGILYGWAWMMLAQAGPSMDVGGWPSWIINGGVGALAIWAIMALINKHTANVEKITADFRAAVALKDQQILDQGREFKNAVEKAHDENRTMLKEMRDEHQKNVDAQFQLSREQVSALEHVTAGMNELKTAVQSLAERIEEVDPRPSREPRRRPNQPPPGPT